MDERGKDSVLAALTALHVAVTESRQLQTLSIKATPNDLAYLLPKLAQSVHKWSSAGSKLALFTHAVMLLTSGTLDCDKFV